MKKNLKWILLPVLLVALIAGAGLLYNSLKDQVELDNLVLTKTQPPAAQPTAEATQAPQATAAPVRTAPDFTAVDENGNEVTLSSFIGKPVVANFWASWCTPCQAEMPAFQKAWETYGDQVQFLIVNMTDGDRETLDTAKAFMAEAGYTFPVVYDINADAAAAYAVRTLPTTCFIAADGSLTAKVSSGISLSTLERGLKMILE